jgi:hypothetical protein
VDVVRRPVAGERELADAWHTMNIALARIDRIAPEIEARVDELEVMQHDRAAGRPGIEIDQVNYALDALNGMLRDMRSNQGALLTARVRLEGAVRARLNASSPLRRAVEAASHGQHAEGTGRRAGGRGPE